MEKNVSALLFDLGGVILNLDYIRTIEAFRLLGKSDFEESYAQAQQDDTFDRFEKGEISPSEFRDYIRSIINKDITDDKIDDAWNAMLLDLPAERIDFLKELKSQFRIYLYSNTNAIHLKKFQEIIEAAYGEKSLLENVFHKTYYSHIIGMRKPNANGFEHILSEQNLSPQEVIFIDDSLQHVKGASAIGINAVHLENTDVINLCKTLI